MGLLTVAISASQRYQTVEGAVCPDDSGHRRRVGVPWRDQGGAVVQTVRRVYFGELASFPVALCSKETGAGLTYQNLLAGLSAERRPHIQAIRFGTPIQALADFQNFEAYG